MFMKGSITAYYYQMLADSWYRLCLQFRCCQSMMLRISVRETFLWKRSMDIKGTKFVWIALKSASSNKPMIHIKENSRSEQEGRGLLHNTQFEMNRKLSLKKGRTSFRFCFTASLISHLLSEDLHIISKRYLKCRIIQAIIYHQMSCFLGSNV